MNTKLVPLDVVNRITAYLSDGGLFNPECAIHDNVRDLLIDARAALNAAPSLVEPAPKRFSNEESGWDVWEKLELGGSLYREWDNLEAYIHAALIRYEAGMTANQGTTLPTKKNTSFGIL